MLPRDRAIKVANHEKPDRIPLYGWVSANMSEPITKAFGSVAAFEDHCEFDYAHLFGGPSTCVGEELQKAREASGWNVSSILDGVVELGYQVVHPYQESAGMDHSPYRRRYRSNLVLMGGLDVQTTIGFGKMDFLKTEIERVLRTFADGGLLFCTSHFVQSHCTIEELTLAFDTAHRLCGEVCQ